MSLITYYLLVTLSLQQGGEWGGLDSLERSLDPVANSPCTNSSADVSHERDVHLSTRHGGGAHGGGVHGAVAADADLLNISSDQSSPFSALSVTSVTSALSSKASPALSNSSSLHVSFDGTLASPAARVPASVDGLDVSTGVSITLREIEECEDEEHAGPPLPGASGCN